MIKKRCKGKIYVVSTPIGNLDDITLRAIKVLEEVDFVVCEDTRHTLKLLNHLGIKKKLYSHNSYNQEKSIKQILSKLEDRERKIALVSDSGTPCISDPGTKLISTLREREHEVIPIPGASAGIALLSVSGFRLNEFIFVGFLSRKKGKRLNKLKELSTLRGNIILYESPKRVRDLVLLIEEVFRGNEVVIGRELTKKFEEIIRINVEELSKLELKERGEYTLIIENKLKEEKKERKERKERKSFS